MMYEYVYLGDRSTAALYKGRQCNAVRRADGKCVRGKNGNMIVVFDDKLVVVQARLLRKIKRNCLKSIFNTEVQRSGLTQRFDIQ